MATINYVTLQIPDILWKETEVIQSTPSFDVRKYKFKKGIIFRCPHELKTGMTCHAFIEHEINLSNTLRTGTLTMKVQVTFVPCHMGVFSGYKHLEGSFDTVYWDEDDDWGEEKFVPSYNHENTIKNIVPLPVNIKSNLYEYLNHILFQYVEDEQIISKYAIDLGCQKEKLKENFIPMPELSSDLPSSIQKHHKTIDFFNGLTSNNVELIPEGKQLNMFNKEENND